MVCTPTIRTKKGNVFFYFLSFNFCYLFFMRTCVDNACSMSNIGILSHTYHTTTYTVGCGVREREPAEKEPSSGHTKNYLL